MKICVGKTSFPEFYIINQIENLQKVFLIVDTHKKLVDVCKNLVAYSRYYNKKIDILQILPSDGNLDLKSQIEINYAYMKILTEERFVTVILKDALQTEILDKERFLNLLIDIKQGSHLDRDKFIEHLYKLGYIRVDYPEFEGEFSVRGNFIRIITPHMATVEIDLWGDVVDGLYVYSKLQTRKKIGNITIFPLYIKPLKSQNPIVFQEEPTIKLKEILTGNIFSYDIPYSLDLGEKINFSSLCEGDYSLNSSEKNYKTIKLDVSKPLFLKEEKIYFQPENQASLEIEFEPLNEGDYVIHEDFGVGIYRGIEVKEIRGKNYDFMIVEYADGEKVYLSYLHLDKIHKYKTDGKIKIDKLGAPSWKNLKNKVKEAIRQLAKQLISLYSDRMLLQRKPLDTENDIVKFVEDSFEYPETEDQILAIKQIKEDFKKTKPMDRLICGDVGFGKTEVAIRAVAIAVSNGYQVAVLVPTTVLAYQHYKKFKNRLEPVGIKVENLSRLISKSEQNRIVEEISSGKVDVVVGTHRILQEDIRFKNLGLIIIDEEHRFGVKAKEALRQLKKDVDTIYISATPIPRTLNMVLSNLKDISVIRTPPEGRIEVKTFISTFDEKVIKKAIDFELGRNGQIFYLHNKIETIKERVEFLKSLCPKSQIDFIHGKMKPKDIEKKILMFLNGDIDVLVATSIIETGIDIPTANTLIVERADLFGLTQLYHIRGRVGRGDKQAYCYLLVPQVMTEEAKHRMRTLMRLTRPGSGLNVAMEDMKIRGPGNLFGVEQSGFIKAVGFDMYMKLFKEVLLEERGIENHNIEIDVDFEAFIPEEFIETPQERLNIYMALSNAQGFEELDSLRGYIKDFYGDIPEALDALVNVKKLQRLAQELGFKKATIRKDIVTLSGEISPDLLIKLIKEIEPLKVSSKEITFSIQKSDFEFFLNKLHSIMTSLNK